MSVINVSLEDTFEQWRVKTNQISSLIGDQASLNTTSTSIVTAINEVRDRTPIDGVLSTGGEIFQVNTDGGDGPELILDLNGNLTIAGNLYADVVGDLIGNAATATKLRTARIISITGDATWDITFDGSANATGIMQLNPTGVIPGSYTKFTVDGDGRITSAVNAGPLDIAASLGYTPVSEDAGYNDPDWITGLNGSKLLANSTVSVSNVQVGNRLLLANGSASAPSLSFTTDADQNTGLYWGGSDGYMFFSNNGAKSGETQPGGNLVMVGNVAAYSDIRLKKDIVTIKDALGKVNRLRGIYYTSIHSNERSVGVVAQELQKEVPELIRVGSDGMLSVSYGNITGLLLQAINELTERVKAIEAKLN